MPGQRIGSVRVSRFDKNAQRQLEDVPVDRTFAALPCQLAVMQGEGVAVQTLLAAAMAVPDIQVARGCCATRHD